jgi:phosphatidate cytidylyltransferase
LVLRVAAAAVLAPIVLASAWAGGIWFALLAALAIGIGGHEWTRLCGLDRPMSIALLIVTGPVVALALMTGGTAAGLIVLALAVISAIGGGSTVASRLWPLLGVVYLGIPLLLIGGPRLAPAISPGKTWAGAIGGLLLAVAGGYWGAGFMETQLPFGAIGLAICLSVATQCGDLFESWVKRRFGKKDSGTLIPGHGGILDRIDGLLFAAPVMAAIIFAQ